MSRLAHTLAGIGGDRLLDLEEAQRLALDDVTGLWRTYSGQFESFTGATLDPQFSGLEHPADAFARPRVPAGTTVLVVGTGPSLAAEAGTLKALRDRFSIWTSLRGAEALAALGIEPDVIFVQHASDLDAHLTARHLRDRNGASPLTTAPMVCAEPRTPAGLLAGIDKARLAALDPTIGWGHWPATLAVLAIDGGASAIGLLGIDLGTQDGVDPAHAPLAALLAHIALRAGDAVTVDFGHRAPKVGWPSQRMRDFSADAARPIDWAREAWPRAQRSDALDERLRALDGPLTLADECRALARAVRDRRPACTHESRLHDLWRGLLEWRHDAALRIAVQEGLGARFLPRFWRRPMPDLAGPLWRPALLAAHELVAQAETAKARLARGRTGRAA